MNGILLIDKPEGWTSHDVVAKLRGVVCERRAGHSGTLDPMATGLLVVFFGRATRAVEFAESDIKEYRAGICFGITTNTQDITGHVLSEMAPDFTEEQLDVVLSRFRGDILQIPPMYSAVKVGGKKLYEIARRGGEIERRAREIHIYALERESAARGHISARSVMISGRSSAAGPACRICEGYVPVHLTLRSRTVLSRCSRLPDAVIYKVCCYQWTRFFPVARGLSSR